MDRVTVADSSLVWQAEPSLPSRWSARIHCPSACSIHVSARAFVRFRRIVRKLKSVKVFVFSTRQVSESHSLRHYNGLKSNDLFNQFSDCT